MKFVPLNNRILVELIHEDDITPGGLIIPEQAKEKPQRGRVVSVGKDSQFEAGETILMGKFAGSLLKLDGRDYLILLEEDVFGKLEG